jgi:flagellar protein FlbD
MIKLTRLNGDEFVVNADLIRFIESRPDTYVTLTSDERLIVRESVDEVVHRAICYARAARLVPGEVEVRKV